MSVTQTKDKVITTTLTQKGFAKEAHRHVAMVIVYIYNLDPILREEKELPSINHLPNGNDRIILPGEQHKPPLPQKGSRKEMETQHP